MPAEASTIRQLPESVAIRLRSTLAVTSLSDAISELVQNSLDANAQNIKIQANLSRNSCVVEDDGVGIAPVDVGMVGKMYATSKYPPPSSSIPVTFGFRGQALSSLATHSLFTLISRHREHRSTHTVRISYSTPIFTGLAPEHLRLPATGTVVRIEGLWGDMPVRIKARQQEDVEREWEDVNRTIVQLLLTPQGKKVAVIVRDENGNRRLVVKDGGLGPWEMGVVRQVYGREVVGMGWERVKAQQGRVKIEGWICTKGSGTRGLQFLYINNHPLPPSTTLLHAEINRILAASSFGVVEEDEAKAAVPKTRGFLRKRVEKWGVFILRIECLDSDINALGGEGGTEGKAGLEGDHLKRVIDLLQKLLREFLKTHNFRPFAISLPSNTQGKDSEVGETTPPLMLDFIQKGATRSRSRSTTPAGSIRTSSNSTRSSSVTARSREGTPHGDTRALATWSRAKSAKSDPKEEEGRQKMGLKEKVFAFSSTHLPREAGENRTTVEDTIVPIGEPEDSVDNDKDGCVLWTNPISRRSFQVNSRTGNTTTSRQINCIPPSLNLGVKRPASSHSFLGRGTSGQLEDSPAKRSRRSESTDLVVRGAFVEQLLKNWKNPVFKHTSAPIPSITTGAQLSTNSSCNHDCADDFVEATSTTLGKLTKEGLQNAEVIAQVDRKYILIKMRGISNSAKENEDEETGETVDSCELLVIVDQHAADERVRVESLFAEICRTPADPAAGELYTPDPLYKNLVYGVKRCECELMKRYEGRFKEWGINYHLSSGNAEGEESSLHIDSLPRAITDRCTNEPSLAIDMIRKHIYTLSDQLAAANPYTSSSSSTNSWVKRIGSCPKGLLDMLNSRACRSAIMFNDPLELRECRVLMNKLGECMFPFQCAHGRPSMIPLVDLGLEGGRVESLEGEKGGGFMLDFRKWMAKKDGEEEEKDGE